MGASPEIFLSKAKGDGHFQSDRHLMAQPSLLPCQIHKISKQTIRRFNGSALHTGFF